MTKCEFCGKEKEEDTFCIGASNVPDWTMVEGTGKMTCPDCYDEAMEEGQTKMMEHFHSRNNPTSKVPF